MTDEIRIYHVDDPNDAPDRRLGAFPTINAFLPTSLTQYVIPPVENSLRAAIQYCWYSAYQQGVAAQRHQQQQQQQQQQQHQLQLQQLHLHSQSHSQHAAAAAAAAAAVNLQTLQPPAPAPAPPLPSSTTTTSSSLTNHPPISSPDPSSTTSTNARTRPPSVTTTTSTNHHNHLLQDQQPAHPNTARPHDSPQPLSAASTARIASSSSSSSASSSSSIHSQSPQSSHYDHDHTNHLHHHRSNSVSSVEQERHQRKQQHEHIKKPLNPFMIFMQKQRPEIVRQGIIKESAAINQLLGQQWRKLTREEQEPYYKLAEQEKLLHAQKYPGWSARDNYANQKKRKKLKLKSISLNGLDQSDKKCRARFGLGNMVSWCKPCKRKKKCIYSMPRHQDRSNVHMNMNNSNTNLNVNGINDNHTHLNHHHLPHHPHHHLNAHHHNPFHLAQPPLNHPLSFQF